MQTIFKELYKLDKLEENNEESKESIQKNDSEKIPYWMNCKVFMKKFFHKILVYDKIFLNKMISKGFISNELIHSIFKILVNNLGNNESFNEEMIQYGYAFIEGMIIEGYMTRNSHIKYFNYLIIHNYATWDIIEESRIQILTILLQFESFNIHKIHRRGYTPIMIASKYCNIDILNILLQNGANINDKNVLSTKPIHIAAMNGNFDAVLFLLEKGANPYECTNGNWNAINYANDKGYANIIELLQKK